MPLHTFGAQSVRALLLPTLQERALGQLGIARWQYCSMCFCMMSCSLQGLIKIAANKSFSYSDALHECAHGLTRGLQAFSDGFVHICHFLIRLVPVLQKHGNRPSSKGATLADKVAA